MNISQQPLITIHAPAKVNLALSVGGALGADHSHPGYHPIATWMGCTGLVDEVRIYHTDSGLPPLTVEWAKDAPKKSQIDWPPEKDLTLRAIKLLEVRIGKRLEVCLHLLKRIPVGAGLGGGSADAAAVLVGANALCGLGIDAQELAQIASSLGSDVAYFLDNEVESGPSFGDAFPNLHPIVTACVKSVSAQRSTYVLSPRPAFVSGLGEKIERADSMRGAIVLIIPRAACPTGPVYKAFDSLYSSEKTVESTYVRGVMNSAVKDGHAYPLNVSNLLRNDLEVSAVKVVEGLGDVLVGLRKQMPFPVHLTGSGSCMFMLVPDDLSNEHKREIEDACSSYLCSYVWTAFDP